eukprot:506435_1
MPTRCALCSKLNASNLCSGCKQVHYCDVKCQKQHWKRHKKVCKSLAKKQRKDSNKAKPIIVDNIIINDNKQTGSKISSVLSESVSISINSQTTLKSTDLSPPNNNIANLLSPIPESPFDYKDYHVKK